MKQMQRWKLLAGCVALVVVGTPGSTRAQGRRGAPREGVMRSAPETAHGLDAEEAVDLDSLEAEERGARDGRTGALGGFGGGGSLVLQADVRREDPELPPGRSGADSLGFS